MTIEALTNVVIGCAFTVHNTLVVFSLIRRDMWCLFLGGFAA
jgi:hypothetical protein